MSNFYKFLITIIMLNSFVTLSYAQIKCWVGSEGIRECGEKIPPQYSQKSHEVLSNHGITIEESGRAKTKEERIELQKLAKIEAEKIAKKEEQKRRDRVLLATYIEKEDIQKFANEKISDINSIIVLAQKRNTNIQTNLDQRIANRDKIIATDKEPAPILLKDIEKLEKQMMNNQIFIDKKIKLQKEITQEYAEKIERFIYLTSGKK